MRAEPLDMTLRQRFPWLTAMNCSIGQGFGLSAVRNGVDTALQEGFQRIELWWPFTKHTPPQQEVEQLIDLLESRNTTLIALNLWAGDMAAGERGVLHKEALPETHLQTVKYIHTRTGVHRFNLLLGAGGVHVHEQQIQRLRHTACWLRDELPGRPAQILIEPLSGVARYPVRSAEDALLIADQIPGAGLLLDLYHLAMNHGADYVERLLGADQSHATDAHTITRARNGEGGVEKELQEKQHCDGIEPIDVAKIAHVQVANAPGRGAPRWCEEEIDPSTSNAPGRGAPRMNALRKDGAQHSPASTSETHQGTLPPHQTRGTTAGEGTLPIHRWVQLLRARGYTGEIAAEWLPGR